MSVEVTVRLLRHDDLAQLIALDGMVTGMNRPEFYRQRIDYALSNGGELNSSLVAEVDGKVAGFLMATLFFGEFCIPEAHAVVDSVVVDPALRDRGVGSALFEQFLSNMRVARVEKVYTLVDWDQFGLLKFFGHMGFSPSRKLSLEYSLV